MLRVISVSVYSISYTIQSSSSPQHYCNTTALLSSLSASSKPYLLYSNPHPLGPELRNTSHVVPHRNHIRLDSFEKLQLRRRRAKQNSQHPVHLSQGKTSVFCQPEETKTICQRSEALGQDVQRKISYFMPIHILEPRAKGTQFRFMLG